MKKILISGYYGFGNIGDEAILKAMIQEFDKMEDKIELTVLSHKPEETTSQFKVKAVDRSKIGSLVKSIRQTDVLVSGGGSLLQESTSKLSIYYYLFIYFVAMIFRKKIIVYSHGIGPVHSKLSKRLIKFIFNKVAAISVRDQRSKDELITYGVSHDKIEVTADPVVSFSRFGRQRGLDYFKTFPSFDPSLKTIGFAIKGDKNKCIQEDILTVIDLLKKKPCNIVMVPFHFTEDMTLMQEIANKSQHEIICIDKRQHVDLMMSMIEAMDVLVGVRLHALIFSAVSETPVVGLSYDPKIDAFLETIDEQSICCIDDLKPQLIYEAVMERLDNKEKIKKHLNLKVFAQKLKLTKYNSNIEMIIDLR